MLCHWFIGESVTRQRTERLIRDYLPFIHSRAMQYYELYFDIETMVTSDFHDG